MTLATTEKEWIKVAPAIGEGWTPARLRLRFKFKAAEELSGWWKGDLGVVLGYCATSTGSKVNVADLIHLKTETSIALFRNHIEAAFAADIALRVVPGWSSMTTTIDLALQPEWVHHAHTLLAAWRIAGMGIAFRTAQGEPVIGQLTPTGAPH